MTQEEVYSFLKKNKGKWFAAKEINKKLEFNAALANLSKLFKYREIRKKEIKQGRKIKTIWSSK